MRFGYFIIFLTFCVSCCAQNADNSKKVVADYKGIGLSEAEIKQIFEKELLHFETIQKNTEVEVIRLRNAPEYLSRVSNIGGIRLNLNDLDRHNIGTKLFFPYKDGIITTEGFLSVMDTLNKELKRSLLILLYRNFVPQLAGDNHSIDRILEIDKKDLST